MEQVYDIFEALPDGSLEWRECVDERHIAIARAGELAARSANEFRVMHLPTSSVVVVLNAKEPSQSEGGSQNPGEHQAGQGDVPVPWWSLVRRRPKSIP